MSKKFRVAIVGCGSIAAMHLACLREMESVEIVAAVDIKIDRAAGLAGSCNAKAYSDYIEMLETEKPDVVHLCTPHYLHAAMALEAAEQGVAVFTEKPPAMNRKQWKQLELAADLVPLGICFQNRYNKNVQLALGRLRAGEFGELRGIRANVYWTRDASYYADDWHGTWALEGGGALINQSIHTLDLMNLFVNRPFTSVQASMWNHSLEHVIEVEDTMHAYVRYDGIPAMFFATNAYSTNAPVMIELDCEKARVVLDGASLVIHWTDRDYELADTAELAETGFKDYWGRGHAQCIADFYHSLATDQKAPISVEDVTQTMDLLYSIYESCGRPSIAEQLNMNLAL